MATNYLNHVNLHIDVLGVALPVEFFFAVITIGHDQGETLHGIVLAFSSSSHSF